MRPVLDKQDFYKRFHDGEFGNRPFITENVSDCYAWLKENPNETVMIRSKRQLGSKWKSDIGVDDFHSSVYEFTDSDYGLNELSFNQNAPDHELVMQGYLQVNYSYHCWEMEWNMKPGLRMRDGMKQATYHFGTEVMFYLEHYMYPKSFAWTKWLLNAYPNHTIELTIYRKQFGVEPGHNTIFWEVRNY